MINMDRETQLDAFRGYRDVEPGASLAGYVRKNGLSVEDYRWMLEELRRIDMEHKRQVGNYEPQKSS